MFDFKELFFDFWRKKDEYKSNIINSLFFKVDTYLKKTIEDVVSSEAGLETEGLVYRIVESGASGLFVGKENHLAYLYNDQWRIVEPEEGIQFYDKSLKRFIYWDGTAWVGIANAICKPNHNELPGYDEFEHIDWSDEGQVKIAASRFQFIDSVKIGEHGNRVEIDENGNIELIGNATQFDDLRFPFSRDKQGQSEKPDFDFTNVGLLFPQNDDTEIVTIIAQFSHSMKIGSTVFPHIHFNQDSATTPTFKMDYRWYDSGDDPTGSFTTVTFDQFVFSYTSGTISQITYINNGVSGSSITDLSSVMECKIYRDDNDVSGDVLTKEFDIHYEKDSLGSNLEYSK